MIADRMLRATSRATVGPATRSRPAARIGNVVSPGGFLSESSESHASFRETMQTGNANCNLLVVRVAGVVAGLCEALGRCLSKAGRSARDSDGKPGQVQLRWGASAAGRTSLRFAFDESRVRAADSLSVGA